MSEVIEWPTSRVRKTFIDFFVEKCGHTFVKSSKVIPYNDPTLKFCNAGMNQFKPIFLGTVDPSSDMAKLTRAANSQKCIRAGGKHNDLEDVGKDSYHHTFFEMLGNWSFGDYFKREAIKWAWELLTVVYGLDPNRLYVTYFGGNEENNLQPDEETRDIWTNEIGIPASRVLPFGMKENFWEMGDTGPCGPCTEIHYDRLGGRDVANLVNYDDPTVIEIWNLVFIQYNREDAKTLKSLPSKHVDTGMGLERVTSILQNKLANYDIDIFKAIFEAIQEVTGCPYPYGGKYDAEDAAQNYRDTAYRVVADHIRTLVIALTDGARPSGTDRGSVIRCILRRAARYGEILGGKAGFFSKLVPVVVSTLKDAFPDLDDPATIEKIQQILLREEESFAHRLVQGTHRFMKAIKGHEAGYVIPGKVAATLQHTDGFPIDLTKRMAEEHGMKVDMEQYAQAIKEHKEISGKKEEEEDSDEVDGKKAHFKLLNVSALSSLCNVHKVGPTDDSAKYTSDTLSDSTILAIWNGFDFVSSSDDCPVSRFAVFLDKTNFYAEQGGQTFDTGLITTADNGATFEVSDVRLCGRYVMHVGQLKGREGLVRVGDKVNLQVDYDRRRPVMANHTSTHMINFALLEVIGSHVCQKGSDVLPGSFRFDYAAKGKPQPEQLKEVEDIVNRMIQAQLPVYALEVPKQLAVQINGIRMMADEDYPDPVRVVCIGTAVEALLADPTNSDWTKYSIEFCGGTHLKNTSESKLFALIKEEALAADVRRVIAVTGEEAQKAFAAADKFASDLAACAQLADFAEMERTLKQLEETLKQVSMPSYRKHEFRNSVKELGNRILEEIKKQKKGKAAQAGDLVQSFVNDAKNSSDSFFVCQVDGFDRKQLADVVRNIAESPEIQRPLAVLVINRNNKKADIMAQAHKDLVARGLDAGAWASEVSKAFGGKGGGKGERGNGNLPSEDNIEAALALAKEVAQQKLSA